MSKSVKLHEWQKQQQQARNESAKRVQEKNNAFLFLKREMKLDFSILLEVESFTPPKTAKVLVNNSTVKLYQIEAGNKTLLIAETKSGKMYQLYRYIDTAVKFL
jgi:hypothetical protein